MGEIHSHSIPLESRESVCRIRRRECKVAWSSAFLDLYSATLKNGFSAFLWRRPLVCSDFRKG
jgi:hypothetical protein